MATNQTTPGVVTKERSSDSSAERTWKYAVGLYRLGDTWLADEDDHPPAGEFGDHLLTIRACDGEYVVSCPRCARRVEVDGDYSPAQYRAVGLYAIGHFLAHDCDPVSTRGVADFYLGEPATDSVLASLKQDLAELLVEEAEVVRHE